MPSSLALLGALLLFAHPQASQAASISYDFDGIVGLVSPELSLRFGPGDSIHGELTIDSDTPNSAPAPGLGFYMNAITAFNVIVDGDMYFESGLASFFQVRNNWSGDPGVYAYQFGASVIGPSVNGYVPRLFQFGLFSISDPPAINSDDLPGQDLDFSKFNGGFDFNFGDPTGGPNFFVDGTLSSFQAIAEPSSFTLLLAGLIAFFSRGAAMAKKPRGWTMWGAKQSIADCLTIGT
jgi:hypothetical protein